MGTLTGLFGYSRQSYYLPHKDNDFSENALEPLIVEKAREYRKSNPGLVCAKLGPTLETIYPLEALDMALSCIDPETAARLIHHSDRGCQYCSGDYVSRLKQYGISISMTQSGDPLENAIAERANGILKTEWLYKMNIPTREACRIELERIISFYNTERPHMSIGMQTPDVVHSQSGPQKQCWRNPWEPKEEDSYS